LTVELKIRLTRLHTDAIARGEPVTITLAPRRKVRREVVAEDVAEAAGTKEVRELIRLWNEDEVILFDEVGSGRNNPISEEEQDINNALFRRAVKEIGMKVLRENLATYFRACREGKHRTEGRNHGYKHLGGFIQSVLKHRSSKTGGRPWWADGHSFPVTDKHPKLTLRIANAYAERFLKRPEYGLSNPSKEYRSFKKAGDWVRARASTMDIETREMTDLLLDCVEELCEKQGTDATPGRLASDMTWKNYMPQFLARGQ